MAKAMSYGVEDSVTVATTQTLITGVDNAAWVTIDKSDQDLYIVHVSPSDGAALPSSGRWYVPTTALPYSRFIGGKQVSIAAAAGGTAEMTFDLALD